MGKLLHAAAQSGEKIPDVFEGKVDMAFDRTDGNVEGFGYFLGRHSPVTGHHEYPLTLGRHRADNPVKPAGSLYNRHTFLNVSGMILAFRGGGTPDYSRVVFQAEPVINFIADTDKEIVGHGTILVQPLPADPQFEKNILKYVLGSIPVMNEGAGKSIEPVIVPVEEFLETLCVPFPDIAYELSV